MISAEISNISAHIFFYNGSKVGSTKLIFKHIRLLKYKNLIILIYCFFEKYIIWKGHPEIQSFYREFG
jgi:hypothetical protein